MVGKNFILKNELNDQTIVNCFLVQTTYISDLKSVFKGTIDINKEHFIKRLENRKRVSFINYNNPLAFMKLWLNINIFFFVITLELLVYAVLLINTAIMLFTLINNIYIYQGLKYYSFFPCKLRS